MSRKCFFSEEERIRIAEEYVFGNATVSELSRKYGMLGKNMILTWIKKYHIGSPVRKKKLPLPPESISEAPMKDSVNSKDASPETQKLLARIAQLEKELKWEQMRTQALETLIDVAEENGLKVRKKSGAKQ